MQCACHVVRVVPTDPWSCRTVFDIADCLNTITSIKVNEMYICVLRVFVIASHFVFSGRFFRNSSVCIRSRVFSFSIWYRLLFTLAIKTISIYRSCFSMYAMLEIFSRFRIICLFFFRILCFHSFLCSCLTPSETNMLHFPNDMQQNVCRLFSSVVLMRHVIVVRVA